MQYQEIWDKVLNSNEEVKYEFSVGVKYLKVQLIVWIVLALLIWLVWSVMLPLSIFITIIAVIKFFYTKNSNAYAFTDRRILVHTGWLSTQATSINYDKITEVSVDEPFFARLITKSGYLTIHTGNIVDALVLEHIENPYEIKKKLDSLRNVN